MEEFTPLLFAMLVRTCQIRTARSKHFKSASRMRRLPYTFVLFWCAQTLDMLVLEKVGQIGQGLKRDAGMKRTLVLSPFLDQVHVSETWLGGDDAVLYAPILSEVQIPLLLQSKGKLSAPTPPKRGSAFSCWLYVAHTQMCRVVSNIPVIH